MAAVLLENGASVTAKDTSAFGNTPLHIAARQGNTELVQLLLLKGADKDALDGYGQIPLSVAALNGREAIARTLLAAGADVSVRDEQSRTLVHLVAAAEEGYVEILNVVVAYGADVNAVGIHQETALHLAAVGDQKAEMMDVLVDAGAKIEARAYDGRTPLHDAADLTNIEPLLALLGRGAYVNALENRKHTPLFLAASKARKKKASEIVDALLGGCRRDHPQR